ncbi:ABC transporter permease subunit [Streptomyces sp. PKU-EA00015]|uniref:ABC transporter permease subunit n=1 Tax=Streptomyces sp. PKU-EA00015 TaxID=2748326 RepID=UPI00210A2898|nr:ABC transporter permease subunit [Streptomyces sp. PKU-EA00015]
MSGPAGPETPSPRSPPPPPSPCWKIDTTDAATAKVSAYWQQLLDDDLIRSNASFSPEWINSLKSGGTVGYLDASWGAGVLKGTLPEQSGKWAVAPMPTWDGKPFGVYLSRVFSAGYVPDEALEAARIDGAGELRTFWSIGLRMLMPGFATVFLFQFTAIWNNFFLPLVMLSDQKLFPLSLGLHAWNSNSHAEPEFYPLVVTGSLLAVIPLIVAFVSLQRHWKAGLTAGSVK